MKTFKAVTAATAGTWPPSHLTLRVGLTGGISLPFRDLAREVNENVILAFYIVVYEVYRRRWE